MQNTATITRNHFEEPPHFVEMFMRLQARYRSQGITTPQEWPMNTPRGRSAYWNARSREQFLNGHTVEDLKSALDRAMTRLESMPKNGEKIDFEQLLYGQVQ